MRILSNCHTHTQFCDGRSTAEDMVQAALAAGFVSLGFSSHATQHFDEHYSTLPEREKAYRVEIARLQQAYGDRIRIYMGIERDLYSFSDPFQYDYYIASVHYLQGVERYVAVDGRAEDVAAYVKNVLGGQGLALARQYYDLLCAYARAWRPPIIGHFDLIRKNNARLHLYDENSAAYRDMALSALGVMRRSGAMLELNTGGIARGYLPTPYPDDFLLRAWAGMGGEIIVSSDCHHAPDLTCFFDRAPALLARAGFDHVVMLGKDTLFERIAL